MNNVPLSTANVPEIPATPSPRRDTDLLHEETDQTLALLRHAAEELRLLVEDIQQLTRVQRAALCTTAADVVRDVRAIREIRR